MPIPLTSPGVLGFSEGWGVISTNRMDLQLSKSLNIFKMVLDTLVKLGAFTAKATIKTAAYVGPKVVTGSKHAYKFAQKEIYLADQEVDKQKEILNKEIDICAAKMKESKVDFMAAFDAAYIPEAEVVEAIIK